ncbi:MAG TPA: FAD-binding oxidoreductase [Candidatus Avipropionibacterium avicola]|uniref:FAD-binding oxidoreductase n=1 Tax=Candidatus Avipropionibacterium avicola TaxID=2840701 RepID=A0A9D1GWT4_9ACTN|nr:FAD-binding oxidoreductase [Candidatus Avipropionibacterium avicola]
MKWWGWGVEGVAFNPDNKPKLAPFVLDAVGLDLSSTPTPPISFDDLDVPAPQLPNSLQDDLVEAVGETYVHTDDMDRVVHTYGKSLRDLIRIRANILPRVPDVVVYPSDEDQVRKVVDVARKAGAVLIPFGGGSNISGSLEPRANESRAVISLDMGRMNRVLDIDEDAQLARIQAGTLGPDVEEQLNAQGWTMGHFPDSFTHSTVGGWAATRSSGMQSDKYGDIADIIRGLRVVQPDHTTVIRPLPSTATGPSVREMLIGSEGRLGVITEVTAQVHRLPEHRVIQAYLFADWPSGLAAMREIAASDASPSVTRISDANETGFSFATQKESTGASKYVTEGLMKFLELRGWDLSQLCLSFIGYEGSKTHVSMDKAIVDKIVKKHKGIGIGTGPGQMYDQKKFDTPYIRDFLLDRGAMGDVSETAAPWSRLQEVYDNTVAAARAAYDQIGVKGWVMCHLSHSYHSGACLYFTFAYVADEQQDTIEQYDTVKRAIQQSFIDHGGTLSHHHAVGTEHSPWLEQDISAGGVAMMQGVFDAVDPKASLNPGKIIPE